MAAKNGERMSDFALLLGAMALGALMNSRAWMPANTPTVLNAWVLKIALPALILGQVPKIEFAPALAVAAVGPWLVFGGAWLLMPMLGRRLGWSRGRVGALILTCGLGNTAFMGLPMIQALFGSQAIGVAVIADQLGSFLALSIGGVMVAARYSGTAVTAAQVLRRVVLFPPFMALALAVVVALGWGAWPLWLDQVLGRVGATLTPIALFAVGYQLRLGHAPAVAWPIAAGLGWKLLAAPALILALGWSVAAAPEVLSVTVAQCAMAPMITAGILAADADLEPSLAAAIVGVGILLSFATVPLWALGLR